MIHDLIQQNYAAVVACVFLVAFIFTTRSFDKHVTRLFSIAICTVVALIAVDSVELVAAEWAEPSMLRIIMSAFGYSLRPLVVFFVIMILRRDKRRGTLILAIPALLNILLSFSACFCGVMFSYSTENSFHRGPLGYFPFAVSGFYLVMLVVFSVKKFRDGNHPESFITFVILVMSGLGTYLESAFYFDGLLNSTCAISLTFYYLYLHTQSFKRDTLTSALNRRCLYVDAAKLKGNVFGIISIDLNNLKKINDTYGHAAGDKAICTMVDCIRRSIRIGCTLYRTGGDEFMLLCNRREAENVNSIVLNIRTEMEKTEYSCAIGSAMCRPDNDFEKICAQADMAMYKDKTQMKEAMRSAQQ